MATYPDFLSGPRLSPVRIRTRSACLCAIVFMCGLSVIETAADPYATDQDENYAQHQQRNGTMTRSANSARVRLLKSDVIGNIHCQLTSGYGAASQLGVVRLPRGDATDFAVLDQSGTRFSGSLPFHPNHAHIGKAPDGSVTVGFGALRLNSGVFRPRDSPEPIRIHRNNDTIFESAKAWDFDVAADGSSFVVHEPVPRGTSQLIIRHLESGNETRYVLGTRFTPVSAYSMDYAFKYSIDFSEVGFEPAYADAWGRGNHWVFPVNDGVPRHISTKTAHSAILSSSSNRYFIDPPNATGARDPRRSWTVSRKELRADGSDKRVIWQRSIELEHFSRNMHLSRNGRWLALNAWEIVVLSAETGETRFHYRTVNNVKREFARLRPVLPDGATVSDLGSVGSSFFIEDYLIFSRRIGTSSGCDNKPGQTFDAARYRACLRDQRLLGKYRWFQDVFDMNDGTVDGSPIFRREVFRDTSCSEANSPLPGLMVRNGVLAYGIADQFQDP